MTDQKLENVSLEEGSSKSNEKSKNYDQSIALSGSNDGKKKSETKRNFGQKFKSFINFMIFQVRWFMVIYHSFLFVAFVYGAVRSSYIFCFYPLTDEWVRVIITWTYSKLFLFCLLLLFRGVASL